MIHRARLRSIELSPTCWILLSGLCFGCMSAMVKVSSHAFSGSELAFYRSLVGLVVASFAMVSHGIPTATPYLKIHIVRGVVGIAALILYFHTIAVLPLTVAVTLTHTAPLFVVPMAVVILNERASWLQAGAIVMGFCGVVLLLQPTISAGMVAPSLIGVLLGVGTALGYINMRQLGTRDEPNWRVVFYFTLICTIGGGLYSAATGFHKIDGHNVWQLTGVCVAGTLAEYTRTQAYSKGRTLLITTLTYSNVVFASLIGAVVLLEIPPLMTFVAFTIIAVAGILASRPPAPSAPLVAAPALMRAGEEH